MQQIGIRESQEILLEMAIAIKEIAERHSIQFFMVGGTMLGAIRHKGFIPWDDDMDFGVKYCDFWNFAEILKKELPSRYKCVTYEDKDMLTSFFYKVIDTETYIDDPCLSIPLEKKYGLGIDIFPIVSCSEKNGIQKSQLVYNEWITSRKIFTPNAHGSLISKVAKLLLQFFALKKPYDYTCTIREIVDSLEPGDFYCNIVSPQFWKIMWTRDTFDNLSLFEFEDKMFLGPSDYNSYLTRCYKNYMQLPPAEKRRVHSDATFKK